MRGWRGARALVLVVVLGIVGATSLRAAGSDEEIARRYFSPEEIRRGRELGDWRALCLLGEEALGLAALAGFAFSRRGGVAGSRLGVAREALAAGAVCALAALPVQCYQGFVLERELGLSTQSAGGWALDWALEHAIVGVLIVLGALLVDALQRWWPRRWWVAAWAAITAGIVAFMYLQPLVIAPLFNHYRPLEAGELRDGCTRIAREAGIPVSEVYVIDASRRTKRYNAFFTGVGATRSIALYDTMVQGVPVRQTLAVVGHEAGHWVHHHLLIGIAVASAFVLAGLGLLSRPRVLGEWPLARPGAAARMLLAASLLEIALLPAECTISRAMEAQADRTGLDLARDDDATVQMLVALARANVSNLLPHPLVKACLFTHPPIPERIRMALEHRN